MKKYSIVIPTYNRAKYLYKCLISLKSLSIPSHEFEIIIVDDGSTDNTEVVVKNFFSNFSHLSFHYIKQENQGPAAARNVGIKNAAGSIIFFTDDDCIVPENWIESMMTGYKRFPDAGGVGGYYMFTENNGKNIFVQYYYFIRNRTYKNSLNKESYSASFMRNPAGITANMSYKKNLLLKLDCFDEIFKLPGYEDLDLKKRVCDQNIKILYLPNYVIQIKDVDLINSLKRFINFGRNKYIFIKKHDDVKKIYKPSFRKIFLKIRDGNLLLNIVSIMDSIFTLIGWNYQKMKMHNFKK